MTMRTLVAVLALASACKNKDSSPDLTTSTAAPTGSGSAAGMNAGGPPASALLASLPMIPMPPLAQADDPKRGDKIALGQLLFFDKRLSGANDRACYSCHMNENGNGGKDPIAIGSGGKTLTRHSPVLWNVAFYRNALYWDGRSKDLETTAKGAWGGGNMGAGADNLDKKAAEIAAIAGYKPLFAAAFGADTVIKADHVASALAEYMRTLVCADTAYDKFAAGDRNALTEPQMRGFNVMITKGGCITCHAPPFFSSAMGVDGGIYFNVGIGTQGVPEDKVDVGRMAVTKDPKDWAKFKPVSLRNVTRSAPYFHDGSVAKLEDAVRLMAGGGIKNKNLESSLADRGLTDAEVADIVAFLGALECPGRLEEPASLPQ